MDNQSATSNISSFNQTKNFSEKEQTETGDISILENLISLINNTDDLRKINPQIVAHINKLICNSGLKNYQIFLLHNPEGSIQDFTASLMYNSLLSSLEGKPNILLIIESPGGSIAPAYLISKCCRTLASKFLVVVPRKAKSAATLIALGADEIHMGIMSELGPIDPQIGNLGLPALGLSSALESIAKFCKQYPESSDMFAKYLSLKLDLSIFGYCERVSESASQYAQFLLESVNKPLPNGSSAEEVAKRLVYSYKDHSFVIDQEEAKKILGDRIQIQTKEYLLGYQIYGFLELFNLLIATIKNQIISIIGSIDESHIFYESRVKK